MPEFQNGFHYNSKIINRSGDDMFRILSILFTLAFLTAGILLGVLNPTPVSIDLFLISPVLPLSVLLALVFILGLLIGAVLISLKTMPYKWKYSKSLKENRKQASEILELKKKLGTSKNQETAVDKTNSSIRSLTIQP